MFMIEYSLHPRDKRFNIQKIFAMWKPIGKSFDNTTDSIALCNSLSKENSGSFRVKNILNGEIVFETEMKEELKVKKK